MDLGEALGLLSALIWVRGLLLGDVDFELDSKIVVDSLYESRSGVSNYSAVINDCRHLLASDLATTDVRFIRRQSNEVAHSLARAAPCHAYFCIHIKIHLVSLLLL